MTAVPDRARARFAQDGFVVAPALLDAGELTVLGAHVDQVMAEVRDDRRPSERTEYERQFAKQCNTWEDHPPVRDLTFHPVVGAWAAGLLEVPAVRLLFDQALYKEPGASATPRHQDQTRIPVEGPAVLTAWIPLDATNEDNGTIGYVAGTHRLRVASYYDLVLGRDWTESEQALLEGPVTFVDTAPGTVVFHHGATFHMANPNRSERTRRVFTIVYCADGVRRGSTWPHPSLDRQALEVGDVIAGPATPIAWPLTDGVPPAPPPLADPPPGWPAARQPDPAVATREAQA